MLLLRITCRVSSFTGVIRCIPHQLISHLFQFALFWNIIFFICEFKYLVIILRLLLFISSWFTFLDFLSFLQIFLFIILFPFIYFLLKRWFVGFWCFITFWWIFIFLVFSADNCLVGCRCCCWYQYFCILLHLLHVGVCSFPDSEIHL